MSYCIACFIRRQLINCREMLWPFCLFVRQSLIGLKTPNLITILFLSSNIVLDFKYWIFWWNFDGYHHYGIKYKCIWKMSIFDQYQQ